MIQISGKQQIGFTLSSEGNSTFQAEDPRSGSSLSGRFFEATKAEIHQAVELAHVAFLEYHKMAPAKIAAFLDQIGEEIVALDQTLVDRCMQETALPEGRIIGERGRTVNQLKLFAEVVREGSWVNARIDTALPNRSPIPKPDIRQMLVGLGPVGIFGASNFPLAFSVAGGDTASALAAGCPVVVKGHPSHPGTSELVGNAILKAAKKLNMPEGVFSLLQGKSTQVGQALVRHPKVKAIGFTGSFNGGKALFDSANQRPEPIPVYAEMGSSNPVFILPDALETKSKEIAEGMAGSLTLGVGQFCTNPGLVFLIENKISGKYYQTLDKTLSSQKAGIMLSAQIKDNYLRGVNRVASSEDVIEIITGADSSQPNMAQSKVFKTNYGIFKKSDQLAKEVFGPSQIVVEVDSKMELLQAAENLEGHLTATVHATEKDLEHFAALFDILKRKVGRMIINGYPTGVEVCPSMVHGGPFPATTDNTTTSVGTNAIYRFARPVCYQDFPQNLLPEAIRDKNICGIWRMVNGTMTKQDC